MLVGQTHSYLKGQVGVKKKVLVFFFAFCFFRTRVSIHFQFSHMGEKKAKLKKKMFHHREIYSEKLTF